MRVAHEIQAEQDYREKQKWWNTREYRSPPRLRFATPSEELCNRVASDFIGNSLFWDYKQKYVNTPCSLCGAFPLEVATHHNLMEMTRFLLSRGANTEHVNASGYTVLQQCFYVPHVGYRPLEIAEDMGKYGNLFYKTDFDWSKKVPLIRELLDAGADWKRLQPCPAWVLRHVRAMSRCKNACIALVRCMKLRTPLNKDLYNIVSALVWATRGHVAWKKQGK